MGFFGFPVTGPWPRGEQLRRRLKSLQASCRSRDDLVQVVFNYEITSWLRAFGLAFELLLLTPGFSARGVCAFQFVALEDFVWHADRYLLSCQGSPADNSFSNATRSNSSLKCLIRYSG